MDKKIRNLRLHNQLLNNLTDKTPSEIVGWMGAIQAQDYNGARWAIGLRNKNSIDQDIEKAFNEGKILRTHVLRPTWHFVLPQDIRWMLELTAPRIHAFSSHYYRKLDLHEEIFKKSNQTIINALIGGKQLTRSELVHALENAKLPTEGLAHFFLIGYAELEKIICNGPRRGKQHTYMLLDERVPQGKRLTKEEALGELSKRYFQSHGPATIKDFSWWSGLTITDAKKGIEMIKSTLTKETIDEKTYWFSASAPMNKQEKTLVYLLPNYDEYIVGYTDRSAIFDSKHISKLDTRANPLFQNTIVLNGEIVGTWKRTQKKECTIETTLFKTVTKEEKDVIHQATEKYKRFVTNTSL